MAFIEPICGWGIASFEDDDPGSRAFVRLSKQASAALVYLVELDAYQPGGASLSVANGITSHPSMSLGTVSERLVDTVTYRLSDRGYVSRDSDSIGLRWYRPYVQTALTMERTLPLAPESGTMVGASWGEIELTNPRDAAGVGYWDGIVGQYAADGRPVRVLLGGQDYDGARGLWNDWRYKDYREVFRGIALGWYLEEDRLRVPVRDQTYRLEGPLQSSFYAGTGGLGGTAELAGKPLPKTRGRCLNVSPALVDPVARIFQYTDAPGQVLALYERGKAVFAYDGDVADIYAATVASGSYKTDNARGLIRLGADPVGPITADVKGSFPAAGYIDRVVMIARYLLTEDMGIAAAELDLAAFIGMDAAFPYEAGIFVGTEPRESVEVQGDVLRSIAACLGCGRDGRFRPYRLTAPADNPAAVYGTESVFSVTPIRLPETLFPPNYRRVVGYQRNWTPQVNDLAADVTADRRQFLGQEYRVVAWFDGSTMLKHARASDPPQLSSILLNQPDAQAVANHLGGLWGAERRVYDISLGIKPLAHDIGQTVFIDYPIGDLTGGRLVTVVGERIEAASGSVVLKVMT